LNQLAIRHRAVNNAISIHYSSSEILLI